MGPKWSKERYAPTVRLSRCGGSLRTSIPPTGLIRVVKILIPPLVGGFDRELEGEISVVATGLIKLLPRLRFEAIA